MKTFFNIGNAVLLLVCFGLALSSCKEKTITPGDLIPEIDNIHTFGLDASYFDASLHIGLNDSIVTSNYDNYLAGIGKVTNDPFYGTVQAGLYLQFVPPATFFAFPENSKLDSAFIILPYAGVSYGDITSPSDNYLDLTVHEIAEAFHKETDYYNFQTLVYNNTAIGGGTHALQSLTDTIPTATDTLGNQLKIRLDNSFADKVFSADESKFVSSGAFLDFLKGFHIRAKDGQVGQNRISYFKLLGQSLNTTARLAFYIRDAQDSTFVISFPFNTSATAYFNAITRDYKGTPSGSFLNNPERDSVLVQGYPGFYTEITLRNLDQIPASIINKAELIITSVQSGEENTFTPPPLLTLQTKDANGELTLVADALNNGGAPSQGGLSFVGGVAESKTIDGHLYTQYKLNFPRALQLAIKEGKRDLTLRVSASTSYPGAFRLLGGGLTRDNGSKLKINIVYTKN